MRYMMALCLLSVIGCSGALMQGHSESWASLVACAFAAETLEAAPAPGPAPAPKGICTNCNGTGRLGDGVVSVPCPVCGGDGRTDNELPPAKPDRVEPPKEEPPVKIEPVKVTPPVTFPMVPWEDVAEFFDEQPATPPPPKPIVQQQVTPPPPKPLQLRRDADPDDAPVPDKTETQKTETPKAEPYPPPEEEKPAEPVKPPVVATQLDIYHAAYAACKQTGMQCVLVFADSEEQAKKARIGLPGEVYVIVGDYALRQRLGLGLHDVPFAALLFRSDDGNIRLSPTKVLHLPDGQRDFKRWSTGLVSSMQMTSSVSTGGWSGYSYSFGGS